MTTIEMTEEQLIEYTERVIREAVSKTTTKRAAQRKVLVDRRIALEEHFDEGYAAARYYCWVTTETDEKAFTQVRNMVTPKTTTELRKQIAGILSALRRLENAQIRTSKEIERKRLARHRELDREEARHHATKHKCTSKSCQELNMKIAIGREVANAPPLNRDQINTVRRILS